MHISPKFAGLTRNKTFTFICLAFYLTISSATISADPNSTCWVYRGWVFGVNTQLIYGTNELVGQMWPDPDTAFMAFEQFASNRLLGKKLCILPYYSLHETIAEVRSDRTRVSSVTSGLVGHPGTGIPIGYSQVLSAFNEVGEGCSVGGTYEILDGTYYGYPQCRQNYTVKLSPLTDVAESGTTLVSVKPGKTTENLVARVYDQSGKLVPNVKVKLVVNVQLNSGGHQHDDGRHINSANENRVGKLASYPGTTATVSENGKVLEGNTKQDGLRFSFKAPAPAGDHKITASCTDGKKCTLEGPDTVWVGHKELQPVGDNAIYQLIPNAAKDPGHPDNHYLTLTAISRLAVLATLYHAKYPDFAVLHLNDASLERGGIFDLNHNWRSPHWEHCRGAVIDIRANGVEGALNITDPTDPMIKKFQVLAAVAGADAAWEVPKKKDPSTSKLVDQWETRHFHTKLTGQEGLQCP